MSVTKVNSHATQTSAVPDFSGGSWTNATRAGASPREGMGNQFSNILEDSLKERFIELKKRIAESRSADKANSSSREKSSLGRNRDRDAAESPLEMNADSHASSESSVSSAQARREGEETEISEFENDDSADTHASLEDDAAAMALIQVSTAAVAEQPAEVVEEAGGADKNVPQSIVNGLPSGALIPSQAQADEKARAASADPTASDSQNESSNNDLEKSKAPVVAERFKQIKNAKEKEATESNEQEAAPAVSPQTAPPPIAPPASIASAPEPPPEMIKPAVENKAPTTSGPDASRVSVAGIAEARFETSAEVAPTAQETTRAEAHEPLDQIVLGLKSKFDARTGKAEIRMEPPNLGAVKVSLSLESGNLTAQFESASEMVRDLLKSNLGKLKSVLEGQGVAVDRLAVQSPANASDAQGQGASFGSAAHDGRSAGQYHQEQRSGSSADAESFAAMFEEVQEAPLDLVA